MQALNAGSVLELTQCHTSLKSLQYASLFCSSKYYAGDHKMFPHIWDTDSGKLPYDGLEPLGGLAASARLFGAAVELHRLGFSKQGLLFWLFQRSLKVSLHTVGGIEAVIVLTLRMLLLMMEILHDFRYQSPIIMVVQYSI